MNKSLKLILKLILTIFILITGFYFWASSSNYSIKEYSIIHKNNYATTIESDSVFKIVTYNIGYLSGMTNNLANKPEKTLFDSNLNLVLSELRKIDADFIAFQEIDFASKRSFDINQQNEIAKLGYNYVAQAINWDKRYLPFPEFPISVQYGRILSGQSILSKYIISDHNRIELYRNPTNPIYYDAFYIDRLAQIVKVIIQNKTLVLINVHTEAFHKETRTIQIEKIIELYEQYNKNHPTILLGDFNSDMRYKNSAIELILKLPNTGCAAFNIKSIQNTFDSKNPSERLDYIFYNTDFIEIIDGRVLSEFKQSSDHLPLLMSFKFK